MTYNFFGKRVIILIDEIDYTVLNFLESNIKELSQGLVDCSTRKKLREISDTIEQMGQTIIKPSTSFLSRQIRQVILTGITNTLIASGSSALNQVETYTVVDAAYQEFYGANEEEIKELIHRIFEKIDPEIEEFLMAEIKKWYNGYGCPDNPKFSIYNIYSVMSYFENFKLAHKDKENPKMFKGKAFWTSSSINEIITNFKLMQSLDLKLLQKLYDLAIYQNNSKDAIFNPDKQDLCLFIKGLKPKLESCIPYLLLHTGYLTMGVNSENEVYFRVPNQEIFEHYSSHILPPYAFSLIKKEIGQEDQFKNVSEIFNNDLEFDETFEFNVNTQILSSMTNTGKINEMTFESVIFSLIFWYYIQSPSTAQYKPMIEKFVEGGKIDTIFEPNHLLSHSIMQTRITYTIIIHEYKIEESTSLENVENAKEQAYWQIFCKNYLSEPLSKYKLLNSAEKDVWKVKLRPILFHCNENRGNWHVKMANFEFSFT